MGDVRRQKMPPPKTLISNSSNAYNTHLHIKMYAYNLWNEFQLAEDKKIPGLDHIDVTFEGAQIRKLWNNFHKNKGSQESEITQEEMESFHKALRTHARNTLKLCLDDRSIFILTQVRLSTYLLGLIWLHQLNTRK